MTLLLILAVTLCLSAETQREQEAHDRQADVAFLVPAGEREETISWWSEDKERAFVFFRHTWN